MSASNSQEKSPQTSSVHTNKRALEAAYDDMKVKEQQRKAVMTGVDYSAMHGNLFNNTNKLNNEEVVSLSRRRNRGGGRHGEAIESIPLAPPFIVSESTKKARPGYDRSMSASEF